MANEFRERFKERKYSYKNKLMKTKKKQIAENQVKALASGAIVTVVKAINTHIGSTRVCGCGCSALLNITKDNGKLLTKHNNNLIKQMRTKKLPRG